MQAHAEQTVINDIQLGQSLPHRAGTAIAPIGFAVEPADGPSQASIGGVAVADLVATYGTPLYVMDAATIRQAARGYKAPLTNEYSAHHLVVYACKANLSIGLAKLLASEGLGFDIVSAGELYTVHQAGVPMERVIFNGNNKQRAELQMALELGVNRIVVDNLSELALLSQVAHSLGQKANILLRITPGIECHTHDYIKTGQADSKFGFSLDVLPKVLALLADDYANTLTLCGLHAHIGSQIFELKAYEDLVTILMGWYERIRGEYGWTLPDLDMGGGLGIAYTTADDPHDPTELLARALPRLTAECKRLDYPLPRLLLEPGRSLVARAGVTLYTVGSRKDIEGYTPFVAVDGGMGDNIRPALYQAAYTAIVANKLDEPATETVKLAGKYCESGDILLPNFVTPTLAAGDTVLVFGTGAYNHAMSSQYNRFGRPAMVLVEDGRHGLLIKREELADLTAHDRVPEWLQVAQ